MTKSYWRGHEIICVNEEWIYNDTKELVCDVERNCGVCNHPKTNKDHDYCIQNLPGVQNGCCGHGETRLCYIQYENGRAIYGKEAQKEIEILKEIK